MRTALGVYKTYSFVNKDPVIDDLRTLLKSTGTSYKDVQDRGGPKIATLHSWFHGTTKKPTHPAIKACVRAVEGYDYRIVKVKKR